MSSRALAPYLRTLLDSLPPHPIQKADIDKLVEVCISQSEQHLHPENRKNQWEVLLRNEIYRLAETEGSQTPDSFSNYYDSLCDRLDVILSFSEHDACDPVFPFTVIQDLLETQTIDSCSRIFSWLEQRSSRLTEGMVPQKGKALVLLRALNDLLRRLSKTGKTTMFCGRILTFLSSIFPLGERSGVNLRGEYGPQWETVSYREHMAEKGEASTEESGPPKDEMAVDNPQVDVKANTKPEKKEEDKKETFYDTFWSLQSFFSRPFLFAQPGSMESLKNAVNMVMPVIKEATVKERAMMGSKAVVGNLKRKRESSPTTLLEDGNRNYFFAKFLTSPDLLDLEISDTLFRRQFLFQLLILLSHLLQFTKAEKAVWATPRNRSLHMDFILENDDATWVQETINRVYEELRQTAPNGRAFSDTVQSILEREKNWIRWKNDLCPPFDKEALPLTLEERAAPYFAKMSEPVQDYKHKLGSESLTEIWAMGYRDLFDLQIPFNPGEVKSYVKDVERENKRIADRRKQLRARYLQQLKLREEARKAAQSASPAPVGQTQSEVQSNPPTVIQAPTPKPAVQTSLPRGLPTLTVTSPPLHPSLPAKPGTIPLPATPAVNLPQSATVTPPAPAVSAPPPAPPTPQPPPDINDPLIMKAEENKLRLSWLALRIARDEYLPLFGKIGNGDIVLLNQEIEKEKERIARGDSQPANTEGTGGERLATPTATPGTKTKSLPEAGEKEEPQKIAVAEQMDTSELQSSASDSQVPPAKFAEVAANSDAMPVDT